MPRGSVSGRSLYVTMPGAAATTAGIAWIGGIAVMMWPSPMKSSIVLAFSMKSGGGRKPTCIVTVGSPSMVIFHGSPSTFQSGSSVWPLRHRTLRSTTVLPPTRPCQLPKTPATQPALMVHEAISTSSVVCAYSASQTISSSSTPNASATRRTASAKIAVPCDIIGAGRGRRWACRSHTVSRYRGSRRRWCRRASAMVTLSTRAQPVAATMASSSAKPGLTPEPNIDEPPCLHASSIRSRPAPEVVPGDERRGRHDVHARRGCARARRRRSTSGCRRRSRVSARAARRRHWWP